MEALIYRRRRDDRSQGLVISGTGNAEDRNDETANGGV
jgi:hypothetical protein